MKRAAAGCFLIIIFLLNCAQSPKSGIDLANMDQSVRPQDDLYNFVNGQWLTRTEIPADKSNYGAFTELFEQSEKNLKSIIEEAAYSAVKEEGSENQQVGDFYLSYLDSNRLEQLGLQPLEADLQQISSLGTRDELTNLLAYFIQRQIQIPFLLFIDQDMKNSTEYIVYLNQSGLGLPDRDYYFKEDPKFQEIRAKYLLYISDLFKMAQLENSDRTAEKIIQMEKSLAESHWTRVENRDRDKTYNKYQLQGLNELTPDFSWHAFFQKAGLPDLQEVIIRQPSYFIQFNKVYESHSLEDWKLYLTYKLLDEAAPYLNSAFVDLHFNFHQGVLSGVEELSPRWKRAVNTIDEILGEAVGKLYVQKYFKPEAKERMVLLVENLRKSYAERIKQLDWMSPETKQEALQKLSKFRAKIGYPDKWKDYSGLVIEKDQLLSNYHNGKLAEFRRETSKLGKPIDREEWFMTPQTVNAYYNPNMNEVVFPAAILQPPFFNLEADEAVNYGAIGAVIGHEMTHGFDDQGRKSDGEGNLRNWWTTEDEKKFNELTQILVDQFDNYSPIDTLRINGELTLGENIADLGGLTIAYNAYQMSLAGKDAPVIDGWTGEQRFFLGWAQIWRRKYRDEELRRRLVTDPHSPSQYRVIGPLVNMPEFYLAFAVAENDKMFLPPEQRVLIW
jgi:putative endopeptidase